MPDPRWTGPPEVIALTFEAGFPASVIASNVVWVTETVKNEISAGLSTVNTLVTAEQWQGVGSLASTVASTGLNAGLHTLVGWTAAKISITQAAVDAFTIARSSVVPSVVSMTNRDEWATLNATNFFGQNTPAIVERDTEYFGEHWPHNSSVGWTYSGALSALTAALAVPPPVVPMGTSPAAPAAASTVAQAAAQTGVSDAVQVSNQTAHAAGQTASTPAEATGPLGSLMQQPLQLMSSATEPVKELTGAPMQAVQGFTSFPQSLTQAFAGMFPTAMAPNAAAAEAVVAPVAAGGLGAASAGGGGGVSAFPGAGLTSYTRPASTFEPETGGRPAGLRAGILNAAQLRGPTTSSSMGTPMPMSPAGMLAHGTGGESGDKKAPARARIVVDGDQTEPR